MNRKAREMNTVRRALAGALAVVATACGGGGSPTATPSPSAPAETYPFAAVVYFDENRNNVLDPSETIRLGEVQVEVGGRTGASEASTGRVSINGVPGGVFPANLQTSSLPPFFVPGATVSVTVPSDAVPGIPVALPIGSNTPFGYLVSGDSIAQGTGAAEGRAFRNLLQARLAAYYERAVSTFYRGGGGGTTEDGAARLARDLQLVRPAYTLIAWGTNDYNVCADPVSCFTTANLRAMVREVKSAGSLPVVETILPCNAGYDVRAPASRNVWVAQANDLIRAMARDEGALLVDTHAVFMKQPDLSALFVDHVHPNQTGHQLIADTFFTALTKPRSTTGTAAAGAD
jgi:lysophospholipase L1-like esterase